VHTDATYSAGAPGPAGKYIVERAKMVKDSAWT
jgi:hypothetical protein